RNIEHPIRLYRVVGPQTSRPAAPPPHRAASRDLTWTEALLDPSSLAPLLVGAYLLATRLGLPPSGRLLPVVGAVLIGIRLGRLLRPRTGQRAFSRIALGAGLVLAAVAGDWRHGPVWWLVLGGVILMVVGVTQLRTREPRRE